MIENIYICVRVYVFEKYKFKIIELLKHKRQTVEQLSFIDHFAFCFSEIVLMSHSIPSDKPSLVKAEQA